MSTRKPITDGVFLYVLAEGNGTEFTKVGMSTRRELYERLRSLNQGNPRELNFKYIWAASHDVIRRIEKKVKIEKDPFTDAGRTEWYKQSPDSMATFLSDLMGNSLEEVIPIVDDYVVPYYAKNKSDCPIQKRYFTGKPLFPQLKEVYKSHCLKKALTEQLKVV